MFSSSSSQHFSLLLPAFSVLILQKECTHAWSRTVATLTHSPLPFTLTHSPLELRQDAETALLLVHARTINVIHAVCIFVGFFGGGWRCGCSKLLYFGRGAVITASQVRPMPAQVSILIGDSHLPTSWSDASSINVNGGQSRPNCACGSTPTNAIGPHSHSRLSARYVLLVLK